jgi:DNA-binding transcriptional MerR regulator
METTTLTLCLDHLYYLTADSINQTGYTLEEVQELIDEKGGSFEIEATITHPVPPPYTVEWDIEQYQNRIQENKTMIVDLQEQLTNLEEGTDEYTRIKDQITAIEEDIVNSQNYITSLQAQ